ncbi:hypothetical protein EV363DRAFT_1159092 [Boletus edulis]|uniref:Uncharacterized protein n=1 Tax=Boletus edulis BED1 TaxID=1328754 RepID=A0AAD4GFQ4_BOLED|nr:hypothetical protein EV363DRAFT_1159092 [Boletus edulis]KAF8441374.1 hypothetical protein L210DRAFT_3644686 [Boletus edulis BED1]
MPSLSDQIDHLAATAKAIRTSAAALVPSQDNSVPTVIPFTRAVLDTALGDLIRDIDASELGLFTLVPAPDADVRKQPDNGARRAEISRVQFPGATPLRKHPPRRQDMVRPKEYEPEVYAHAALKYLDRYQSIRRMPRARSQVITIIEQLDETRENIQKLNETLQELTSAGATPAPLHNGVAEEERRITDLQSRLAELRNQKDAVLQSNEPKPALKPKAPYKPILRPSLSPSPEPENHEDAFWSTPAASARTLRFTDRLLEEDPDFAELSTISFDSPEPAPKSVFARLAAGGSPTNKGLVTLSEHAILGGSEIHEGEGEEAEEDLHDQSSPLDPKYDSEASVPGAPDIEAEEISDEERTVILPKAPLPASDNPPPFSVGNQPQTTPPSAEEQVFLGSSSKVTKVRITSELENIVARIWNTVGDILLPDKGGEKPPRAKETLALIESLATRSPSPSSPASSISSIASASAGPTHHQVNTAQLLHALLTSPNHAMPLNQLKAAIGGTRALYACVAKKLIRIDRGGGEQIVMFDAGV